MPSHLHITLHVRKDNLGIEKHTEEIDHSDSESYLSSETESFASEFSYTMVDTIVSVADLPAKAKARKAMLTGNSWAQSAELGTNKSGESVVQQTGGLVNPLVVHDYAAAARGKKVLTDKAMPALPADDTVKVTGYGRGITMPKQRVNNKVVIPKISFTKDSGEHDKGDQVDGKSNINVVEAGHHDVNKNAKGANSKLKNRSATAPLNIKAANGMSLDEATNVASPSKSLKDSKFGKAGFFAGYDSTNAGNVVGGNGSKVLERKPHAYAGVTSSDGEEAGVYPVSKDKTAHMGPPASAPINAPHAADNNEGVESEGKKLGTGRQAYSTPVPILPVGRFSHENGAAGLIVGNDGGHFSKHGSYGAVGGPVLHDGHGPGRDSIRSHVGLIENADDVFTENGSIGAKHLSVGSAYTDMSVWSLGNLAHSGDVWKLENGIYSLEKHGNSGGHTVGSRNGTNQSGGVNAYASGTALGSSSTDADARKSAAVAPLFSAHGNAVPAPADNFPGWHPAVDVMSSQEMQSEIRLHHCIQSEIGSLRNLILGKDHSAEIFGAIKDIHQDLRQLRQLIKNDADHKNAHYKINERMDKQDQKLALIISAVQQGNNAANVAANHNIQNFGIVDAKLGVFTSSFATFQNSINQFVSNANANHTYGNPNQSGYGRQNSTTGNGQFNNQRRNAVSDDIRVNGHDNQFQGQGRQTRNVNNSAGSQRRNARTAAAHANSVQAALNNVMAEAIRNNTAGSGQAPDLRDHPAFAAATGQAGGPIAGNHADTNGNETAYQDTTLVDGSWYARAYGQNQ